MKILKSVFMLLSSCMIVLYTIIYALLALSIFFILILKFSFPFYLVVLLNILEISLYFQFDIFLVGFI